MVITLMNQDIHTTVPWVKNVAEAEETAGAVDLPHISSGQLDRLRELYNRDFRD